MNDTSKPAENHAAERPNQHQRPIHIAIFASGAGSNAQKIIEHFNNSTIAKVTLVVSNKPDAGVLAIAARNGIPTITIEIERFFRGDAYLFDLVARKIDFIALAGFLWKVPSTLVGKFARRIVNIHPALLPKFGGKGMYGSNVHEAVINTGETETGITIHYVDDHYDNGDIILQVKCAVRSGDTPDSLAQKIHELEHVNYPIVIEELVKKLTPLH